MVLDAHLALVHRRLCAMEKGKNVRLYGHTGAATSALSNALDAPIAAEIHSTLSAAIFVINASQGIDQKTVDLWHEFDEYLIPRILIITGFTEGLQDFDDAVLIAKRLLDDVATPFLVLHEDDGRPCALISLDDMKIVNYQSGSITDADQEHYELLEEFRNEYLIQKEAAGSNGFEAGIFFPAIPVLLTGSEEKLRSDLGIDKVKEYLAQLPSVS
jgi:hypothetical protein